MYVLHILIYYFMNNTKYMIIFNKIHKKILQTMTINCINIMPFTQEVNA